MKKRRDGGKAEEGEKYAGGNPNVIKEAEEKKKGGAVKKKRKDGGTVLGLMTGGAVRPRLDRPGRKTGGRVGANTSPLSTAHSKSSPSATPKTQEGGLSD